MSWEAFVGGVFGAIVWGFVWWCARTVREFEEIDARPVVLPRGGSGESRRRIPPTGGSGTTAPSWSPTWGRRAAHASPPRPPCRVCGRPDCPNPTTDTDA